MKICKQAFNVQVIDGIGTVRVCGWAGYYLIGNLRDNTMHEVFNSEAAKHFRQTLLDGTYDYCNEENCPYMANGIQIRSAWHMTGDAIIIARAASPGATTSRIPLFRKRWRMKSERHCPM